MTSLSSNPPRVPSPMRSKTSLDSGPSETKGRLDRDEGSGGDVDPGWKGGRKGQQQDRQQHDQMTAFHPKQPAAVCSTVFLGG